MHHPQAHSVWPVACAHTTQAHSSPGRRTSQAVHMRHYWRRMGPQTLGKDFAEGCPRQRPLGEFLDGEGVFAEGPLSGTRQRKEAVTRRRRWRFLCRGPTLGK